MVNAEVIEFAKENKMDLNDLFYMTRLLTRVLIRMQFSYKLRLSVIKRNAHTMRLYVKM